MGSKGLQGGKRIFCDEQWRGQHCIGECSYTGTRDDSGHSAAREGSLHIVVSVEAVATHGKKQISRGDGARIDGISEDFDRACIRHARRRFKNDARTDGGFCKREFHRSSR